MIVKVSRPKMSLVETYYPDDCDPMYGVSLQIFTAGEFSHETFFPHYYFDYNCDDTLDATKARAKRYGKRFLRKNTDRLVKKRGFIYNIDKPWFSKNEIPF